MDVAAQISGYFDNALTSGETEALFAWLKAHPADLETFVRTAYQHRLMVDHFGAKSQVERFAEGGLPEAADQDPLDPRIYRLAAVREAGEVSPGRREAEVRKPVHGGSTRRWFWGYAAAVVVLAGAAGIAYLAFSGKSTARLLAVENATWGASAPAMRIGGTLGAQEITLKSGLAKIGFENGNELVVEGPARFAIQGDLEMALQEGRVSAVVSKAGRGFRVVTPAGAVEDHGTEFSVSAGGGETQVAVYRGKVAASAGANGAPREVDAGGGAVVSKAGVTTVPLGEIGIPFKRGLASELRQLNVVDLLAGGDGTGEAQGVGIDAATGKTGVQPAAPLRRGNHQYVPIAGHAVLDGCFIPDGRMVVDSAGDGFTFPATKLTSFGLIWAGANAPWAEQPPIRTMLPGETGGRPGSHVLVVHSNNGLTLNLEGLRQMHPGSELLAFRAQVGNSAGPEHRALASVHVIVDGASRFERRGFSSIGEPFEVTCPLAASDHFLTLATTDGGDDVLWDWVLWAEPTVEIRKP